MEFFRDVFEISLSNLFIENVEINIKCRVWAKNAEDEVKFKVLIEQEQNAQIEVSINKLDVK